MKPLLLGDAFKFKKSDHLSSDSRLAPPPLRTDLYEPALSFSLT